VRDFTNHLGASEVPAVLGHDPWRAAEDVWRAKLSGERAPLNGPMLRGVCLEGGLLDWYERLPELEGLPRRMLLRNPREPGDKRDPRQCDLLHPNGWAAATLDGYWPEGKRVIEAKASVPSKKWNVRTGEAPFNYVLQVQWQIGVALATGLAVEGGLIIMGPAYGELWPFPVEPDAELFRLALARCEEFMNFVWTGEVLPPEWGRTLEAAHG